MLKNILAGIILIITGLLMANVESQVPLITNISWIFVVVGIAFTGISLLSVLKN